MTEHTLPAWLYHSEQGAKLFVTADEIASAEAQGWADSPAAALEAVDIDGPAVAAMPDDGVVATLEAAEAAVEQGETGEIEDALEDAEDAIEKVQAVVLKKRKSKTS